VAHRHDWDWSAAETSYRRALDLNPSYSTAHHWYAELLIVTGRLEEAREEIARACRFDPLSPQVNLDSGLPDYFSERYDRAVQQSRRVLAMDERFVPAHVALQSAYEQLGQYAEAIAELRRTAELVGADPSRLASLEAAHAASGAKGYWSGRLELAVDGWPLPQSPAHVANVLAAAGDNPRALEWLERAYADRDDELVWIAVEPWYRGLHVEPRFQELCRRMGLKPSSS
jgi:tetratricopeptide (TPR) repeat protein